MRLTKKYARQLKKAIDETAERIEDLRSLLQLGVHEMEMLGIMPNKSDFLGPAKKAIRQETLEVNPFWGRVLHGKDQIIRNKDAEIEKLKQDLARYTNT